MLWHCSGLCFVRPSPLVVAFFPPTTIGVVSEYIGNLNLGAGRCHGLLNVLLHVHYSCSMCAVLICVIQMFLSYTKKINLG